MDFEPYHEMLEEVLKELAAHRKAWEDGDGIESEWFDTLADLGLAVKVPSDEAFREEWGEDEDEMWVYSWSEKARKARG